MEDKIVELINKHLGLSFFIGLLALAAFIYLIIWTVSMYYKVKKVEELPCNNHSEKIELLTSISSKMDTLPCVDHKNKIERQIDKHSTIESSVSSINTSIIFMQKSIDSLTQSLQRNKGIIIDPYTQTHSPLSITTDGHNMIQRLGVYEMFDNNWLRIKLLIEENTQSKNPYDIQLFCIEQAVVFPEKFLKEAELAKLKLDAYNTGGSLTSYMKVIAVMARDRYFDEYGINVNDVDVFDPNIPEG